MKTDTVVRTTDGQCPRCEAHALGMVTVSEVERANEPVQPERWDPVTDLASWTECLGCGYTDVDVETLPEPAREEFYARFGEGVGP